MCDYAQLVKQYGNEQGLPDTRYSPAKCLGAKTCHNVRRQPQYGPRLDQLRRVPESEHPHGQPCYTRLTNAFSKKAEMLAYSVAITFMYHNFVRIHQSLRMTPAMKAGVTRHRWTLEEVVDLLPPKSWPENAAPTKSGEN